jgi:hypothetical protein
MAANQRRGPSALPPPRERLRPEGPPAKAEGMRGLADAAEAFRFREDAWTGTCQRGFGSFAIDLWYCRLGLGADSK